MPLTEREQQTIVEYERRQHFLQMGDPDPTDNDHSGYTDAEARQRRADEADREAEVRAELADTVGLDAQFKAIIDKHGPVLRDPDGRWHVEAEYDQANKTPEWTAAIAEREMRPWVDGLSALRDTIEVRHGDEVVGRAGVATEPQEPSRYDQAIEAITGGAPVRWTDRYGIETPQDAYWEVASEAHARADIGGMTVDRPTHYQAPIGKAIAGLVGGNLAATIPKAWQHEREIIESKGPAWAAQWEQTLSRVTLEQTHGWIEDGNDLQRVQLDVLRQEAEDLRQQSADVQSQLDADIEAAQRRDRAWGWATPWKDRAPDAIIKSVTGRPENIARLRQSDEAFAKALAIDAILEEAQPLPEPTRADIKANAIADLERSVVGGPEAVRSWQQANSVPAPGQPAQAFAERVAQLRDHCIREQNRPAVENPYVDQPDRGMAIER